MLEDNILAFQNTKPFDFEKMFEPDTEIFDEIQTMSQIYKQAKPFPHIVIDNLFDPTVLDELLDDFPGVEDDFWDSFNNQKEVKLASKSELNFPPRIRGFLDKLNSANFLRLLEKLTGIEGLVPDPYYYGGGLHQIERGGKLGIHADFNRHISFKLDRRLNLLVYLNKNWKEEYGGSLELWNKSMTKCEDKVLPVFNRCVVFSTTDTSYHGHPDPLTCPEGWTRKSLALYYYSNGRPAHEQSGSHVTLFRSRPGEELPADAKPKRTFRQFLKRVRMVVRHNLLLICPPILVQIWSAVKNRLG